MTMVPQRRAPDRAATDWLADLRRAYGLKVDAVVRMKTVTGLVDTRGRRWVWKRSAGRSQEPRLRAMAAVSACLAPFGIPFAGPVPNRAGVYLTRLRGGETGHLQPWLPGRHADYTQRQERLSAVATLAAMHRAARGAWVCADPALYRVTLYQKLWFKRRLLETLWPQAEACVPALRGLHEEVRRAAELALTAVRPGGSGAGNRPWERTTFCHRDVAPHNLLWRGDGPLAVIDFDLAGVDDPLVDVMQVSNHAIFLGAPLRGHFAELVDVYARVYPLSPTGEQALWRVLGFPDLLARAVAEWARTGADGRDARPTWRLVHAARRQAEHLKAWSEAVRGLPV
jgi:Ser/Thr protein kinase RdoA (MazF antagonist)